eukprot:835929_1
MRALNIALSSNSSGSSKFLTITSDRALWCVGKNQFGEFGIGNDDEQKQLMKCGWSEKIQIRNIYTTNIGYTMVEDMNGDYYSAGYNGDGACTVDDTSRKILTMTPITYFKQNNIKI